MAVPPRQEVRRRTSARGSGLSRFVLLLAVAALVSSIGSPAAHGVWSEHRTADGSVQSGQGIWFYYIFNSTATPRLHDAATPISTGINRSLTLNLGQIYRLSDSWAAMRGVMTITNKGPSATLQLELIHVQSPVPLLFTISSMLSVPSSLTIANGETVPVDLSFGLLTLINLPGLYTGYIRITDTSTGLSWEVPIRLTHNLL